MYIIKWNLGNYSMECVEFMGTKEIYNPLLLWIPNTFYKTFESKEILLCINNINQSCAIDRCTSFKNCYYQINRKMSCRKNIEAIALSRKWHYGQMHRYGHKMPAFISSLNNFYWRFFFSVPWLYGYTTYYLSNPTIHSTISARNNAFQLSTLDTPAVHATDRSNAIKNSSDKKKDKYSLQRSIKLN